MLLCEYFVQHATFFWHYLLKIVTHIWQVLGEFIIRTDMTFCVREHHVIGQGKEGNAIVAKDSEVFKSCLSPALQKQIQPQT